MGSRIEMKDKNNKINHYLTIIDEIEKARTRNNVKWMDILRLAFTHAPEEAKEIIETMENSLREWDDNREDHGVIEDLQRSLHTIKGGARMAGIIAIGDLCHSIESMLSAIIDETLDLNDEIFQLTMQVYDFLVDDIEKVENNEKVEKRKEYIDKIHKMTG